MDKEEAAEAVFGLERLSQFIDNNWEPKSGIEKSAYLQGLLILSKILGEIVKPKTTEIKND